jgi:LacI family transcriptional regulator
VGERGAPDASDRPATSHHVAALAGVSQPTVSRALRGDPRVANATRRRVTAAASKLGYIPSERGRSLSTRRTHRIGVVVDDLANPFYLQLLDALHLELERSEIRMLVYTSQASGQDRVERLIDGSIDGAVLTTTVLGSPLPGDLQRRQFPFVLLNREVDGVVADTCVADNFGGARRVAAELAGLGHRSVGAILGPASTSTGREREAGFRVELAERGLRLPDDRVRRGRFSFETGYEGLADLLEAPETPTAVFCANDVVAMGALNAARARGTEIPRDLTLVGFDDIAMAAWEVFGLTTVRQDIERMASTAATLVVQRIAAPGRVPERVVLPAEMVLRGTHGPPTPRR